MLVRLQKRRASPEGMDRRFIVARAEPDDLSRGSDGAVRLLLGVTQPPNPPIVPLEVVKSVRTLN